MERLIGRYEGSSGETLVLALGALHGNEPAGVLAMNNLLNMLKDEPINNPNFQFSGRIVGFLGNVQAFKHQTRFLKKDLNRQFSPENIQFLRAQVAQKQPLGFEDAEILELLDAIDAEIADYKPKRLVFVDLHTTSAEGDIFSIVGEDPNARALAVSLNAPVVLGLVNGIGGTTLHYFNSARFGLPTTAISFEAGQHTDTISVQRAIAFLVSVLREVGCVQPHDIESRHDEILRNYSKNLPKVLRLLAVHKVLPTDQFQMEKGYVNFQKVYKGEILAHDKNGAHRCPSDGRILMPLYQAQGSDGYFLVEEVV
jgi:succinylglutamate desuccinylase